MSIVSFIVRSICSAEPHCSGLHVVRESPALRARSKQFRKGRAVHAAGEVSVSIFCWLRAPRDWKGRPYRARRGGQFLCRKRSAGS